MKIQGLLQVLSGIVWTMLIVLFLAVSPRCVNAQGSTWSSNNGMYASAFRVYVCSNLTIDDNLNGDAYTDEHADLPYYGGHLELESVLNENEYPVFIIYTDDYSYSYSDASLDIGFSADANSSYDLNAIGSYCDWENYCSSVINTDAPVSTGSGGSNNPPNNPPPSNCANPPNIDSNDPIGGIPGDSNVPMTIYGENLTNCDGSVGSISYWSDIVWNPYTDSDGNYSGYVQFGTPTGNSNTIAMSYSIPSDTPTDLGSVVVQTNSGTAFGPDFNIF